MSLNHSNSPMDAEPEEIEEVEAVSTTAEKPETEDRPSGRMTDKPGGEGGTAG